MTGLGREEIRVIALLSSPLLGEARIQEHPVAADAR